MLRARDHIRLTKGPTAFLYQVLQRAIADLEREGMTLATMTHAEFRAANRALEHRGWYPLHDHYDHADFRGIAIADLDLVRIHATFVSRPLDLGDRTVGMAFEDLHFPYPAGVPIGAQDRFDNIPRAAYGLKGEGAYLGGLWIDPQFRLGGAVSRNLAGGLLSYLTRSLYAWILGTQDPDFCFGIVTDELLHGRDRNRSALDRYGWRNAAPGPNWVRHYPDADLAVNTIWMDRANVIEVLDATPWASGRAAWAHPLQPSAASVRTVDRSAVTDEGPSDLPSDLPKIADVPDIPDAPDFRAA